METTATASRARRWAQHSQRLVQFLVAMLAASLIFAYLVSPIGLIDWRALGQVVGRPWNHLINPALGPKMVQLLAGESFAFLAYWGFAARVVGSRRLRPFLGTGTVVAFWRLVGFASLPAGASLYLLFQSDPDQLHFSFNLHGDPTDPIVLTVPTLTVTSVYAATALILAPRPPRSYLPSRVRVVADVAPLFATVGAVLALDQFVFGASRPWQRILGGALPVQLALFAVEVSYLLTAWESLSADRADMLVAGRRTPLHVGCTMARLAARAALFFGPILYGFWLSLGATLPMASQILDRDGELLRTYYVHGVGVYRLPASSASISPWMYRAVEAIEDPGVLSAPYTHSPINPVRVAGIFTGLVRSLEGDGELSGGSSVAAQSCKNALDRPLTKLARSLSRPLPDGRLLTYPATMVEKITFEFPCGWAFERAALWFGGDRRLLTYYLNQTYFGQGAYGVEAASRTYFGKPARNLTLAEAAFLAGLPQAPSRLDPWSQPEDARARRAQVLEAMVREGYISEAQMADVARQPLGVVPRPSDSEGGIDAGFMRYLANWLDAQGFGNLSTRGLTVTTTIDRERQSALEVDVEATVGGLRSRGVNNGGAVILDPRTGGVLAWVGGVRLDGEPYLQMDVVQQFPHQPGSTIKPLLYACALEEGVLDPDEWLDDTQRVIGGRYVANWDLASRGLRPAAEQLAQSRNTTAAELVERLTPAGFARCLRDRFEVQTDLQPDSHGVDLGMGLFEMPMLELAAAYTALADDGIYREPTPALSVRDASGHLLYRSDTASGRRAISSATATWVTGALRTASTMIGISADVATKTGTTPSSSYVAGYRSDMVLTAWVGRTEPGRGMLTVEVDGRDGGGAIWRAQVDRLPAGW